MVKCFGSFIRASVFLVAALAAMIAGCGRTPASTDSAPPADVAALVAQGDAVRGEAIFAGQAEGVSAPACLNCHQVVAGAEPARIGPNLAGIAARAATTVPGQSAEAYLWQSIVSPNEHVATGYSPRMMPAVYGDLMSEQDIADVVRYLLTLGS